MLQRIRLFGGQSFRFAAVWLVAGMLLAGMSNGARSQADQPSDNTKIIVGQIALSPSHLAFFVALEKDMFRKAGLDVTAQHLSGGTPAAMASFMSGAVNILVGGATEFVEYSGRKIITGKIFAENADQTYDIVSSKDITSLEQLKGKTIAISGLNGSDQIYINAVLAKNGISNKDITFLTTGGQLNRITAMASGAVSAIAVSNATRDASAKIGNLLLKSGDSPVHLPSSMMLASDDLIKNHKLLLKTFLSVLGEATLWMRENQSEAAATCAKSIQAKIEDCKAWVSIYFDPAVSSKYTWSKTLAVNTEGVESAIAMMAELVPETRALKLDDIVDTSIAGTAP
jgi:NitT/TauT family transport system substrate-binding protein